MLSDATGKSACLSQNVVKSSTGCPTGCKRQISCDFFVLITHVAQSPIVVLSLKRGILFDCGVAGCAYLTSLLNVLCHLEIQISCSSNARLYCDRARHHIFNVIPILVISSPLVRRLHPLIRDALELLVTGWSKTCEHTNTQCIHSHACTHTRTHSHTW